MTVYLKDEATSKAVRKLAKLRGITITEAVRSAVTDALEKDSEPKRKERVVNEIKALQDKISKRQKTGLKADKAFFDELSGDI